MEVEYVYQNMEDLEKSGVLGQAPTMEELKYMKDMDTQRTKNLKKKLTPRDQEVMEHKRQQKNIIAGKRAEDERNRIRGQTDLKYIKELEANK